MRFIAAIDTSIYGKAYAQGGEVDLTGWTRQMMLQFLGLGLIQASQVTSGALLDALQFVGSEVTTGIDPATGKLVVTVEMTPQSLDWLTDVNTSGETDGMVLTFDGTTGQWEPKALTTSGLALTYEGLTDVNMTGVANKSIPVWNALLGQWQPGLAGAQAIDALTDVDTTTHVPIDGNALTWDNSAGQWVPGNASSVPGPAGPVTWATPVPWSSSSSYITGPPASVVTYLGSAYVATANSVGFTPTDTSRWRLIVSVGALGPTGPTGPASTVPGPSTSFAIGTVTSVSSSSPATATITGTAPSLTLSLGIPAGVAGSTGSAIVYGTVDPVGTDGNNGDFFINITSHYWFGPKASGTWPSGISIIGAAGATGATGAASTVPGPANTLSIGTTTTLAAGSSATATITGTAPTQTLSLGIPAGAAGSSVSSIEVLMQDGVTGPPVPLETEARDDWIYSY